ncbi:class I SAM-dependent methyltransferase [Hamadaea tsunoensis]|uniref:class I SAM-dependent methyltransferase n=1 Tax=Hamadaea tsunoensis TaxID=53368 RepID=UPI0003FC1B20|nr:class I SAM-dependent methyltransferase [Hamadaea tsunoensis]
MTTAEEANESRARSFGAAADLYERYRPGYPAALFAHIAAQVPGPRVLEIGAGTGIATRELLAAGLDVTALEPDPQMAAVLATKIDAVRVRAGTYEEFSDPVPFDGLVCFQAWHWTADGRVDRAARLLGPGGYLGLVWNGGVFADPAVESAVETLYDEFDLHGHLRPGGMIASAADRDVIEDPATSGPAVELAAHPDLDYRGATKYAWQQAYTAEEFCGFQASTSSFLIMPAEQREALLARTGDLIRERFADRITVDWSTNCYNTRRY